MTVTGPDGKNISLSGNGFKERGRHIVGLFWNGATSTSVDIYPDGSLIDNTANDGNYRDNIGARGGETYIYEVCEADTSTCSNEITIVV